jgi:predicted RNase H-like HicB family nuclease
MIVTAHCDWDGAWWIVDVTEVDGALTQAHTLDDAAAQAADAVALVLGVDPSTVRVRVVTEPVPPVRAVAR